MMSNHTTVCKTQKKKKIMFEDKLPETQSNNEEIQINPR